MEKGRDVVDGPRSILVILKLSMFPSETSRGGLSEDEKHTALISVADLSRDW